MNPDVRRAALTRRRLLGMLGTAALGVAASACAGPGSGRGGGQTATQPAAAATGPVEGEISFAHWRAEDQQVFDTLIARFVEENPGVSVRQDISPSNDYQTTALQRIRGGDIGDVFVAFRGAQFVDMAEAGLYADLSGQPWVENYDQELIAAGQSDGTQLGFPYQLVFNMPVVNMTVLEDAGITERPLSWDGWLAMCDALMSAGKIPMAWPGGEAGNAGQLFNSMVMNNAPSDDMCARIESGEYKVTDDWFLRTLEQYGELRPYFQPNSTGTAVEPAQQLFAQGDAAMLVTGSFHLAAVRGLGGTFPVDLMSPITVPEDELKYEGIYNATFILGANTASQNQAAAIAFLEFLSQPDVAGEYGNGTGQHVTVADVTYENPDLEALSPWLERNTLLAPRFQFNDLDLRNAVENSCVEVVAGAAPQEAAAKAQQIVDQRIA
jgi:raffinose/stachyose/melibiose transport system substrate-binding protein